MSTCNSADQSKSTLNSVSACTCGSSVHLWKLVFKPHCAHLASYQHTEEEEALYSTAETIQGIFSLCS